MALPERLARKAAAKVYLNPENEPAYTIAAEAVRAALDEAAKVVRMSSVENGLWLAGAGTTNGFDEPDVEAIASAIEALKGEAS